MKRFCLPLLMMTGTFAGFAQEKKKVEGSGNVITRDVTVSPFTDLQVGGVFSVSLTQGDKESVRIEAEDNLQEFVEVKNEGSKLVLSSKKNADYTTKKGIKVYVTFKSLKNMDLNAVGSISSTESLSFGDLKVRNSSVGSLDLKLSVTNIDVQNNSVGSVKLEGKANRAVIVNNGVGSIKASDFVVQDLDIDNQGVGSAEVNAAKTISVKDSFLGKVKNHGSATVKKKVTI